MADVTDQLLSVLGSLGESTAFCTSGSTSPVLPGLEVKDAGAIGLPVRPADAKRLIQQASQAPYGRGEETIVDTDVRRVWQLEPNQFTLTNPGWNELVSGIVENVKRDFAIKGRVNSELYKLLIYEKGSFFAPHRDSEKTNGMFATLVICLPSKHKGGELLVTHDGATKEIDFGAKESEFEIQYAAFYADCRHEIKPVKSGYRVSLVYNLSLAQRKRQPLAPRSSEAVPKVSALLTDMFADGSRDKIAIPLKHEYTEAGFGRDTLKGADRACAEVLQQAAESLGYHFNLALMTFEQTGDADYSTVGYSHWGFEFDEDDVEMGEVFEEDLTLDHWIDSTGHKSSLGRMQLETDEVICKGEFHDFPFEQSVHEATGNEGVTVERWYRQAVAVIWPGDNYFRILAREGADSSIPVLKEMVADARNPAKDDACHTFAKEIIEHWSKSRRYFSRSGSGNTAAMAKLLERIADAELVVRFVKEVLPKDYDGAEGKTLNKLAAKAGWQTLAPHFRQFVAGQTPDEHWASLAATVSIFSDLCCGSGKMTAERRDACKRMAAEVEQVLAKWDDQADTKSWMRARESRRGIIESLAPALSAIGETKLLNRILTRILADEENYPLHEVLIPAVQHSYKTSDKNPVDNRCFQTLLDHCVGQLERLTAEPVKEPTDWAQDVKFSCACADCRELQQFLQDPAERVHRFRVGKERRKHLHRQIDGHRCDVDHKTERIGSPHTLVCTKNRASYHRKKQEFKTNTQLLAELRAIVAPPVKRKRSAIKA